MPYRTRKSAVPYLLIAGLGAAPLGGSVASAQDCITLEAIGAVRMATAADIRRANAEPRPSDAQTARQRPAERASRAR